MIVILNSTIIMVVLNYEEKKLGLSTFHCVLQALASRRKDGTNRSLIMEHQF